MDQSLSRRIRRLTFPLALALSTSLSVSAQVIHGHPQKAVYASPLEYVPFSTQCHVNLAVPLGSPIPVPIGSMSTSHLHTDLIGPHYAETAGEPLDYTFIIKAFHMDGVVEGLYGELLTNIIYDATGTSTPPVMRTDPSTVNQWTGRLTINPALAVGTNFHPGPHGWFTARVAARANLVGGGRIDGEQWEPLYSTRDLSRPESPNRGGAKVITESQCDIVDPSGLASTFGTNVTEYLDFLPIAPIYVPWFVRTALYSYSADQTVEPGFTEQRLDPDFHNGVLGTTLMHTDGLVGFQGTIQTLVFDPGQIPHDSLAHKLMSFWTQPNLALRMQMSAISVVNVTIGEGAPPPTLCTDPTAINYQGPLPCVDAVRSIKCDANGDGVIRQADLVIIRDASGQAASGATDPRDGNSDGVINIADLRFCQLRLQ